MISQEKMLICARKSLKKIKNTEIKFQNISEFSRDKVKAFSENIFDSLHEFHLESSMFNLKDIEDTNFC